MISLDQTKHRLIADLLSKIIHFSLSVDRKRVGSGHRVDVIVLCVFYAAGISFIFHLDGFHCPDDDRQVSIELLLIGLI